MITKLPVKTPRAALLLVGTLGLLLGYLLNRDERAAQSAPVQQTVPSPDNRPVQSTITTNTKATVPNPAARNPPTFEPTTFLEDPNYRSSYALERRRWETASFPVFSTREAQSIKQHLELAGLSEKQVLVHWRWAIEDVISYNAFRSLADTAEAERTDPKLGRFASTAQHRAEHWSGTARSFRRLASESFQRATGITNADFYEELFNAPFRQEDLPPLSSPLIQFSPLWPPGSPGPFNR